MSNQKIGIVGSRTYPWLGDVEDYVAALPDGTVVISGGAKGVDATAERAAKERGLECVIHLPDTKGAIGYVEVTERYYARNKKIVDDSDEIVAFTDKRSGGTWNTIRQAEKAGKKVTIKTTY